VVEVFGPQADSKGVPGFSEMGARKTEKTGLDQATSVNLYTNATKAGTPDTLSQNPALASLFTGNLANISPPSAITDAKHPPLTVYFDNNSMENLWLAITWGKG
jgi:hypothetical protein